MVFSAIAWFCSKIIVSEFVKVLIKTGASALLVVGVQIKSSQGPLAISVKLIFMDFLKVLPMYVLKKEERQL